MRNTKPRIIDDGDFAVMIIHAGVAKKNLARLSRNWLVRAGGEQRLC